MAQAHFSLSFTLEADEKTMTQIAARLDQPLLGQVKDLVANQLDGLEFDLQQRYHFFTPDPKTQRPEKRAAAQRSLPIWSDDDQAFVAVQIGSADWFALIAAAGQFYYRYHGLRFTVRYETRYSKGKAYSYWRAYATVKGKLMTKQLGPTDKLSPEALEAVGAYFLDQTP